MPSSSPDLNLYLHFTKRFEQLKVPYMVTGSIAAIFYGVTRLTNDVDVVMILNLASARLLPSLFPSDEYYCPPFEVIGVEMARLRRGHFNLIHIASGFKADVYISAGENLENWAFERRRTALIDGATVQMAPPEYVIVRKLEFYREGNSEKHLRDIRAMLESPTSKIDAAELNRFVAERELIPEWEKVKQTSY